MPRQQTLRATLDWSYGLLNERERALFRQLAVFAGGWTLEAGECVGTTGSLAESDVPELLTALVDKWLVVAAARGPLERFWILETVREYAEERLVEAGEAAPAHDAHRDWCVQLSRDYPWDSEGIETLSGELDNFRAALGWCATDEALANVGFFAGRFHLRPVFFTPSGPLRNTERVRHPMTAAIIRVRSCAPTWQPQLGSKEHRCPSSDIGQHASPQNPRAFCRRSRLRKL
jgi:predicted ATPase